MIPILSPEQWMQKLLDHNPVNSSCLLAYYDHRLGAIVRDKRCLLLPLDDHLVHRGDGIFESIKFHNGKLIDLNAHLERLKLSAQGLNLQMPCALPVLHQIILEVAKAGQEISGAVRVILGRGEGGFDIDPIECPQSSLYVIAHTCPSLPDELYQHGLRACRSQIPVRPASQAKLKTTNYMPSVLMTIEARNRNADISFSFDDDNLLAEAAIANVAIIDSSGCFVVPESKHALMGTTIKRAADLVANFMPVSLRPISEEELFMAKEIFVLGTVHECIAVVEYEGQPVGTGKPSSLAIKLRELLQNSLYAQGTEF